MKNIKTEVVHSVKNYDWIVAGEQMYKEELREQRWRDISYYITVSIGIFAIVFNVAIIILTYLDISYKELLLMIIK
jgi:hypothetical protein